MTGRRKLESWRRPSPGGGPQGHRVRRDVILCIVPSATRDVSRAHCRRVLACSEPFTSSVLLSSASTHTHRSTQAARQLAFPRPSCWNVSAAGAVYRHARATLHHNTTTSTESIKQRLQYLLFRGFTADSLLC